MDDRCVLEKLGKDNYRSWSKRMMGILTLKELDEAVTNEEFCKDVKNKTKDKRAKALIMLNIDDENLSAIDECDTAYDMWICLKKSHTTMDGFHAIITLKKYVNDIKGKDESINEYIYKKIETSKCLDTYGLKMDDKIKLGIILIGLPTEYEAAIRTININDGNTKLEDVKVKLNEEERIINEKLKTLQPEKYNTTICHMQKTEIRQKGHLNTRKNYQRNGNEVLYGHDDQRGFSDIKCYRCNKYGHIGRNCPQNGDHLVRKDGGQRSDYRTKETLKRNEYSTNDNNFSSNWNKPRYTSFCRSKHAYQSTSATDQTSGRGDTWILDSGSTDHIANNADKFTELTKITTDVISAGGGILKCEGKGNVVITLSEPNYGKSIILRDVLYVPRINNNLISVSKLNDIGITALFEENHAELYNNDGSQLARVERENDMYILYEKVGYTLALKQTNSDLWHKRFGHPNSVETGRLLDSYGLKTENQQTLCDICNICKIKRKPFPKLSSHRRSEVLELVHADVMGPINPMSRGGNKFVVVFTDDYSRYCEVNVIRYKSEVFQNFVDYKNKVERRFNRKLKVLRTDGGGEFINKEFNEYLRINGIERELTCPYTPEQNGVAERTNQTLINITTCLMENAGADDDLWREAIQTACYLKNRRTTVANDNKTPYELWNGYKANVKHLRVFGCKCWYLDNKPHNKYAPRGKEGILLGYDNYAKGYKILTNDRRTIVVTRNVNFDENSFPMKSNEYGTCNVRWQKLSTVKHHTTENSEVVSYINIDGLSDVEDNDNFEDTNQETATHETRTSDKDKDEEQTGNDLDEEEQNKNDGIENEHDVKRTASGRKVNLPKRLMDCDLSHEINLAVNIDDDTPSYTRAINGSESQLWKKAIDEELANLNNNDTWTIVKRPKNKQILGTHWVLKRKRDEHGMITKYKARLVALGNMQPKYETEPTYAPVISRKAMRFLMALSIQRDWQIEHVDIEGAYLNARIKNETYVELPLGTECDVSNDYVCKLNKSLYGLKESGRLWNEKVNGFMKKHEMTQSTTEPCMYTDRHGDLIVTVYVDDILLHGTQEKIDEMKIMLKNEFKIKELGNVKRILSINISREKDYIKLDQSDYIKQILQKNGMENCNATKLPMTAGTQLKKHEGEVDEKLQREYQSIIGEFLYLSTNTRPDISYVTSYLGQFATNPTLEHFKATRQVLRYLKGTIHEGIVYCKQDKTEFYCDADWGTDKNDRKSYSGCVVLMSGGAIAWKSMKQRCVALSTAEAELIAANECVKEAMWFKNLLGELPNVTRMKTCVINTDNQAVINICESDVTSERTKHIDIKMFKIRDDVRNGDIGFRHINGSENPADIFTKCVTEQRLKYMKKLLGIDSVLMTQPIQEEC